jgi:hypothetical protein
MVDRQDYEGFSREHVTSNHDTANRLFLVSFSCGVDVTVIDDGAPSINLNQR